MDSMEAGMKYINSDKGFSYVELIIGMVIVSYVILAFTKIFSTGIVGSKNMQYKTIAYNYAVDDIERTRGMAYAQISNIVEQKSYTPTKIFNLSRTVTELTPDYLKQIDVTVTWQEGGDGKSESMTTLVSNY